MILSPAQSKLYVREWVADSKIFLNAPYNNKLGWIFFLKYFLIKLIGTTSPFKVNDFEFVKILSKQVHFPIYKEIVLGNHLLNIIKLTAGK